MIDFETDIFSELYSLLTATYPQLLVTGEELRDPEQFPCVSIVEADNFTATETIDSSGKENHANTMFEIQVFSNKNVGRKLEANDILNSAHSKMIQLGFSRVSRTPIHQTGYFRIVARYTAKVSQNKEIYRR